MKLIRNYHHFFLKTDVLFLTDERCVHRILWIRSLSLFQQFWIKLGCHAQNDMHQFIEISMR